MIRAMLYLYVASIMMSNNATYLSFTSKHILSYHILPDYQVVCEAWKTEHNNLRKEKLRSVHRVEMT